MVSLFASVYYNCAALRSGQSRVQYTEERQVEVAPIVTFVLPSATSGVH